MRAAKTTDKKKKNKIAANQPATQAVSGGKAPRLSGRPINRLQLVRQMIRHCFGQTKGAEPQKSVVAELIRLIALEKELAEETQIIREIKVTWVEPAETESLKSA